MIQKPTLLTRLLPLILTALIIVLDQVTKAAIVAWIPLNTVGAAYLGDFLRIIHVRNPAIAFSLGRSLPIEFKFIIFTVLPCIILPSILIFCLTAKDLTTLQRWMLMGIVGGGTGNLIDRIGRPEGVIDFIDVRFYGIFGMERWPTFNVADSTVVICGIVLGISLLLQRRPRHE